MNLIKRKFWVIGAVLALFVFGCSLNQPGYQADKTIFDTTLGNDLDVVLKPWPTKLVSVQIWLRCGSIQETAKTSGLAHFLEHMIFKKRDLVGEIEARGGYFNAATSQDFTYYYVTVPSTEVKFVIKTLGELLFNNDFTAADFLKEQKVILEEIDRAEQDPDSRMYYSLAGTVYGDHPYGREVLGKKKNIESYKLVDLTDFYKQYYKPNNATLVIAGGFNKKQILDYVKVLEKYPRQAVPASLLRDRIVLGQDRTLRIKNLTVPTYTYVYSVPGVDSPDSYVLDVLMNVLANRENSVLSRRLKEELDLVYAVSAGYQTKKNRSLFIVQMPLKSPGQLTLLKREYQKALTNISVTEEDLALIKINIAKTYDLDLEKVENVAAGLGYYQSLATYKYWRDYLVNINKVTVQDIQSVLRKYFREDSKFLFMPG